MRHWLLKTEPTSFSVDDLARAPRETTRWDGVRNYQARNYLRDDVRRGDSAFLYHSSCPEPGIAAVVRVLRAGYPDATAFDRRDPHFDAASNPDQPRWFTIDVQLARRFDHIITLAQLRAHAEGKLRGMVLLAAGNRLSVTPVDVTHWKFIVALARM